MSIRPGKKYKMTISEIFSKYYFSRENLTYSQNISWNYSNDFEIFFQCIASRVNYSRRIFPPLTLSLVTSFDKILIIPSLKISKILQMHNSHTRKVRGDRTRRVFLSRLTTNFSAARSVGCPTRPLPGPGNGESRRISRLLATLRSRGLARQSADKCHGARCSIITHKNVKYPKYFRSLIADPDNILPGWWSPISKGV